MYRFSGRVKRNPSTKIDSDPLRCTSRWAKYFAIPASSILYHDEEEEEAAEEELFFSTTNNTTFIIIIVATTAAAATVITAGVTWHSWSVCDE